MVPFDDHEQFDLPYLTDAKLRLRGSRKTGGVAHIDRTNKTYGPIPLKSRPFTLAAELIVRAKQDAQSDASARGFCTPDALFESANAALRSSGLANDALIERGELSRYIFRLRGKFAFGKGEAAKRWAHLLLEHVPNLGYRFSTDPENLTLEITDESR
jgi:hypothetical protein